MKIAVIISKGYPAGDNVMDCLLEINDVDINNDNTLINKNNNDNDLINKNNNDNNLTNKNDNKNDNNNNKNNINNKKIINKIIKINDNANIYIINKEHIHAENIDKEIDADLFIFATTHKSEKGVPCLSAHVPGNWAKAELGGKDKELCVAPAFFLKEAVMFMEKINNTGFEVVQECTHHGPFLEKPCMFIEIGSSEKEWSNKKAGMINAKVINHLIKNADEIKNKNYKSAFGIGGLHYTPSFKRIILDTHVAIGHVCPKYNLQNLDQKMLEQAMHRALPRAELAILDWKGLGGFKKEVKELLEKNNIVYKRTKEF